MPESRRQTKNDPYDGMNAPMIANTTFVVSAEMSVILRPILSARLPHSSAPRIMPAKAMAPV